MEVVRGWDQGGLDGKERRREGEGGGGEAEGRGRRSGWAS